MRGIADRMFMVMLQDFMDPWTFSQKNVMKCCKEFLLPGGKQIPFCAYNSVGYREQARTQLGTRQRARLQAERDGGPYTPEPIAFHFEGAEGRPHPPLRRRKLAPPIYTRATGRAGCAAAFSIQ